MRWLLTASACTAALVLTGCGGGGGGSIAFPFVDWAGTYSGQMTYHYDGAPDVVGTATFTLDGNGVGLGSFADTVHHDNYTVNAQLNVSGQLQIYLRKSMGEYFAGAGTSRITDGVRSFDLEIRDLPTENPPHFTGTVTRQN